MRYKLPVALLVGLIAWRCIMADEKIGQRPYEMVWANRTEDTHPATVDFESLDGWTTETKDAAAALALSREQQLWGKYVAKLTYRGTSPKAEVIARPGSPIAIPDDADCVNFWVHGNNWAWSPDPTTPPVGVWILLRTAEGKEERLRLGTVQWKEWWVMHARLPRDLLAAIRNGAKFSGILLTNCQNKDDRALFLDNLSFYKEQLRPLRFDPRPKRGIDVFAGQSCGANTGPGRLPFPTRAETILPDNLVRDSRTNLAQDGKAFVFAYAGSDGRLEYRYEPRTGTLGDVTVKWKDGNAFHPMSGGGVRFAGEGAPVAPGAFELLDCNRVEDAVVARWRVGLGGRKTEVAYTFRLWGKSLVLDVQCLGGQVGEFAIGKAVGVDSPRLVTLPYLVGGAARPAVLVCGKADDPLFVMALMDYYRSNASSLTFINRVDQEGAAYNGGALYSPRTDGRRNDCFERVFLTVSPRFEEVLPNIPNPKSPWMHVAGERLWHAHGAGNRQQDYALWEEVARYGMTKVVITDHETGWRDGGESFTFRTRAAPGKGGDQAQAECSRKLHALGFVYGIYNNYTDFAPVNEHWDEDRVTRLSSGDWQRAWARCYNPKPAWAVEAEARLTPIIQEKFKLSTAYCDVHTCVEPWHYEDYDARVPGAGTFAATFYAYGEIMLHQKQVWNGPVYSEGANHYYYCGLTDGNYGQDPRYQPMVNPWLVDFDLRKMHPLCCNFGMGNTEMFFGRHAKPGSGPQQESNLDRFLAATVAFGHTGFLVLEGGMRSAVRSYYLLQQLQANYARQTVREIRYADENGKLLDTTAAVATGAFARSQIATTYDNGLKVHVNGHREQAWKTDEAQLGQAVLPPNGWFAKSADGNLVAFSAILDGHRADYVDSPAYVYCDGRGVFTRFEKAAADEAMIALKREDGKVEVIPVGGAKTFGVSLDGKTATAAALDKARKELGPAQTRLSRGLVFVTPDPNAFSYLLTPTQAPQTVLRCRRDRVVPGETVTIEGKADHKLVVPAGAKSGERLWCTFDDAWIDFAVVPLVEASLNFDGALRLKLRGNLPEKTTAAVSVSLGGMAAKDASTAPASAPMASKTVELAPDRETTVDFPYALPQQEETRPVELKITVGELVHRQTWWLRSQRTVQMVAGLGERFDAGQCLRKGKETGVLSESGAAVHVQDTMTCGGQTRRGVFMHPPYQGGVGYAFALLPPVELPRDLQAALRCAIGKGDGSDPGDGILFRLAVIDEKGAEMLLAEKQWIKHAWTDLEGDLSPWGGQKVCVKLIADVGPKDNSSGDWACWSDLRIETKEPVMVVTVHDRPPPDAPRTPGK